MEMGNDLGHQDWGHGYVPNAGKDHHKFWMRFAQ